MPRHSEIPIDERRGLAIGDLGYSHRFYFVEAPVEQVAGFYAERTNATSWERDVYSRCRRIEAHGTLFYQLKGHHWTGAEDLHNHPRTISQRLNCKVVELSFQKTASATAYELFDRGERVEFFEFAPGSEPHFEFRLRTVDFTLLSDLSDMSDPRPFESDAFIDATFQWIGLYAVFPPIDESAVCDGPDFVSSPGIGRNDFERVDIVVPLRRKP